MTTTAPPEPAAGPATRAPARIADPDPLVRWLALLAAALALTDAFARLTYTGRSHLAHPPLVWFLSSTEGAAQTWFAATAMALVGVCCLRRRDEPRRWWLVVGVLFCYLAVDDVLMLHEQVGERLYPALGSFSDGIYVWVLVLGPVVAMLGVLGWFHLRRALAADPRRRRLLFAGFAMLGIALAFEVAEDRVAASAVRLRGIELIQYAQWCEETLELFGPLLLLGAVRDRRQRAAVCGT